MNKAAFFLSTINDVSCDESGKLCYIARTASIASANGFGLELAEYCISENIDDDSSVAELFRKNAQAVSSRVLHAPYNELYPHAIDRRVARIAYERYEQAYAIACAANCSKMIVHAGFIPHVYYPEWFHARQVEFWKVFLNEHPGKTVICLENVLEPEPELITDIIAEIDDERLRMCLDIGHANITAVSPMDWMKRCGKAVSHLHLHNNMGRTTGMPARNDTHDALGSGTIPMREVLEYVRGHIPEATITLETSRIKESIEWLRKNGFI